MEQGSTVIVTFEGTTREATVDASGLLQDRHFYDEVHPTREGATRLTRDVARALGGLR